MMRTKNNRGIIALLFVGVLMGALDISIVGPALPSIEDSLQIGARFSGWVFSIYVLFNLVGIPLFSRLSDIYGRRNIYILALSIFAFGSLLVSFAHFFNLLLTGRAIQGFGASGIFPVASALVGDLFPFKKRGRILGLIGAVFGLAFLVGPFIAGIMLHYFSWNILFMINIPVAAVLIFYSIKILPAKTETKVKKIDWGGIVTLGLALAFFALALNRIDADSFHSGIIDYNIIFFFAISLVAFLSLLFIEGRIIDPIIKIEFFRNTQIVIVGIIATVAGLVQACFVFIPKFVVEHFLVEPSTASFMLTPFVLATAVGSPVFGRLIDQFGVKGILIPGLLLSATGFYILSITDNQKMMYYGSGIIIGLGLSVLSGSSLRYIMLNNTSAQDRAISQGMLTIFISIGQLVGAAIIGLILASAYGDGFETIFAALASLLIVITLLYLKVRDIVKPPDENEEF